MPNFIILTNLLNQPFRLNTNAITSFGVADDDGVQRTLLELWNDTDRFVLETPDEITAKLEEVDEREEQRWIDTARSISRTV